MSYGSALGEPIRRVALMVDKILKGTKTADSRRAGETVHTSSEPQNSQANRPHHSAERTG